jgi:hypothetical protein
MTVAEKIAEKMSALPPERQEEVLAFAEFLVGRCAAKGPRQSLEGLWADLDIHITDEDITAVRREMWQNFPRDIA